MKQLKKLPRALKEKMSKKRMKIENWGLKQELPDSWIVVNRSTGTEKTIEK